MSPRTIKIVWNSFLSNPRRFTHAMHTIFAQWRGDTQGDCRTPYEISQPRLEAIYEVEKALSKLILLSPDVPIFIPPPIGRGIDQIRKLDFPPPK